MGIPSGYTTVKLSRELKERLEDYARGRGLTLAGAVADLLDRAETLAVLEDIRGLLEEQNQLLRRLLEAVEAGSLASPGVSEGSPEPAETEEPLPSFAEGNPWLEVIARRGRP